jgi:hypothetical protein
MARLTRHQRQMKRIIDAFASYAASYAEEPYSTSYGLDVFIDDMLFGIGQAIDPEVYGDAAGYWRFRARLLRHLAEHAQRDAGDTEAAAKARAG